MCYRINPPHGAKVEESAQVRALIAAADALSRCINKNPNMSPFYSGQHLALEEALAFFRSSEDVEAQDNLVREPFEHELANPSWSSKFGRRVTIDRGE